MNSVVSVFIEMKDYPQKEKGIVHFAYGCEGITSAGSKSHVFPLYFKHLLRRKLIVPLLQRTYCWTNTHIIQVLSNEHLLLFDNINLKYVYIYILNVNYQYHIHYVTIMLVLVLFALLC